MKSEKKEEKEKERRKKKRGKIQSKWEEKAEISSRASACLPCTKPKEEKTKVRNQLLGLRKQLVEYSIA